MYVRRAVSSYVIALVAALSMVMMIALYTELSHRLTSYSETIRRGMAGIGERLSMELNTSSSRLSIEPLTGSTGIVALIAVSRDGPYIHRFSEPMEIRDRVSIDLTKIYAYREAKKRGLERVCIVTKYLNLFCTGAENSIHELLDRYISMIRSDIENSKRVAIESSKLYPLLAKLMSVDDYLRISSSYIPITVEKLTIPTDYRYFFYEMYYTVEDGYIVYSTALSTYSRTRKSLNHSSGVITFDREGRYVDIISFEKEVRGNNARLVIELRVKYFVKGGYYFGKKAVKLEPLIEIRYTLEILNSSLNVLTFWGEELFSALISACNPEYTQQGCPGFSGKWIDGRESVSGYGAPPMIAEVVEVPQKLGSHEGYVYLLDKRFVFVYRYRAKYNDPHLWVHVGTSTMDRIALYLPWPKDYRSYSSLLFLLRSVG